MGWGEAWSLGLQEGLAQGSSSLKDETQKPTFTKLAKSQALRGSINSHPQLTDEDIETQRGKDW